MKKLEITEIKTKNILKTLNQNVFSSLCVNNTNELHHFIPHGCLSVGYISTHSSTVPQFAICLSFATSSADSSCRVGVNLYKML